MKLILGPLPCHSCRQPVTIVRRDVEQPCVSDTIGNALDRLGAHTHTVPDCGPLVPVDEDGATHRCAEAAAA